MTSQGTESYFPSKEASKASDSVANVIVDETVGRYTELPDTLSKSWLESLDIDEARQTTLQTAQPKVILALLFVRNFMHHPA